MYKARKNHAFGELSILLTKKNFKKERKKFKHKSYVPVSGLGGEDDMVTAEAGALSSAALANKKRVI